MEIVSNGPGTFTNRQNCELEYLLLNSFSEGRDLNLCNSGAKLTPNMMLNFPHSTKTVHFLHHCINGVQIRYHKDYTQILSWVI